MPLIIWLAASTHAPPAPSSRRLDALARLGRARPQRGLRRLDEFSASPDKNGRRPPQISRVPPSVLRMTQPAKAGAEKSLNTRTFHETAPLAPCASSGIEVAPLCHGWGDRRTDRELRPGLLFLQKPSPATDENPTNGFFFMISEENTSRPCRRVLYSVFVFYSRPQPPACEKACSPAPNTGDTVPVVCDGAAAQEGRRDTFPAPAKPLCLTGKDESDAPQT